LQGAGSTLDMGGHAIGSAAFPIQFSPYQTATVNPVTGAVSPLQGTIKNLANINGTNATPSSIAIQKISGTGTLTLDGNNTYLAITKIDTTSLLSGLIVKGKTLSPVNLLSGTLAGDGDGVNTGLLNATLTVGGGASTPRINPGLTLADGTVN